MEQLFLPDLSMFVSSRQLAMLSFCLAEVIGCLPVVTGRRWLQLMRPCGLVRLPDGWRPRKERYERGREVNRPKAIWNSSHCVQTPGAHTHNIVPPPELRGADIQDVQTLHLHVPARFPQIIIRYNTYMD